MSECVQGGEPVIPDIQIKNLRHRIIIELEKVNINKEADEVDAIPHPKTNTALISSKPLPINRRLRFHTSKKQLFPHEKILIQIIIFFNFIIFKIIKLFILKFFHLFILSFGSNLGLFILFIMVYFFISQ